MLCCCALLGGRCCSDRHQQSSLEEAQKVPKLPIAELRFPQGQVLEPFHQDAVFLLVGSQCSPVATDSLEELLAHLAVGHTQVPHDAIEGDRAGLIGTQAFGLR